jgi:hypothetical protein
MQAQLHLSSEALIIYLIHSKLIILDPAYLDAILDAILDVYSITSS